MVSSPSPLTFYFDFISPFAYLGWTQIHGVADRNARPVELRPVLFAAMLNAWGHKGPAEIPPKREYIWKYGSRLAADLGVPLRPPPAHPFNPLLALRLANLPLAPEVRRTVIDRLFAMTWVTGEGVTDPEVVARALDDIGQPGAALVASANEPAAKDRLKSETDAALEAGVFGVPTVIVDEELFWGQDSFGHLERFLRGEDPVDRAALEAWRNVPAGARRI